MRSFRDYPAKERAVIVFGWSLVLLGILGMVWEYYLVSWWHLLVDQAIRITRGLSPLAIIALVACLAGSWGRSQIACAKRHKPAGPIQASRSDRRILGVCGGFAEARQLDAAFVRTVALLLFVAFPAVVTVVYLVTGLALELE